MTTIQFHNIINTPISTTSQTTFFDLTLNIFFPNNYIFDDAEEEIENLYKYILNNYKSIIIISENSGEILLEEKITPNLKLPKFQEPVQINYQKNSGGDNPPEKTENTEEKKCFETKEYEESLCREFRGFFRSDNVCTYRHNGIMVHKAPFDGIWAKQATGICYAEFRNLDGTVTDRFYDSCNDFKDWFLARASRNEKFYVYVLDGERFQRCGKMKIGYGKEDFHEFRFRQKITGNWELVA